MNIIHGEFYQMFWEIGGPKHEFLSHHQMDLNYIILGFWTQKSYTRIFLK